MAQNSNIIGRKEEQALFKNYLESPKAELIAVYGRRRVGKTYLIKSFFNEKFDFSLTGLYDVSKAVQLSQFQKRLEVIRALVSNVQKIGLRHSTFLQIIWIRSKKTK